MRTRPFSLRLTEKERELVQAAAFRRFGRRRCSAAWARAVLVGVALLEQAIRHGDQANLVALVLDLAGRKDDKRRDWPSGVLSTQQDRRIRGEPLTNSEPREITNFGTSRSPSR
jgi:hypothetical protein